MEKLFCAIGFLTIVLVLQDCLVPADAVRVRVVKVKRPSDGHYTKRQATRTSYTDVPLAGDPDVDVDYKVNTNSLRPEDNPYNAGNRRVDYPLNTNVGGGNFNQNSNNNNNNNNNNPTRYTNNNDNNNNRYVENIDDNQNYDNRNYNQNNNNNNNRNTIVNPQFGSKNPRPYQQQQNIDDGYVNGGNPIVPVRQTSANTNNNIRPSSSDVETVATNGAGQVRPVRKDGGKDEDCPGCGNNIPGDAGVDYPNFNRPPKTAFSCSKQSYSGYYADVEARCQVFWICQKNRADAFLCPNGTIFNQQVFVCDWWFNSDCNTAPDYYSRNQYLYAGPTVDLFGNTITPTTTPQKNSPFTNSAVRPTRTTVTSAPSLRPQNPQPERLSTPPQPIQSNPQRNPPPPPQQQQPLQSQRLSAQNNNLLTNTGNNNNNNNGYGSRRNDNFVSPTTISPIVQQQQQQVAVYNKRSHQTQTHQRIPSTYQNNKIDSYDDRLKQPFNYPVPDNSLAAVEGDQYGLRMNNYKTSVDYVDVPLNQNQQQSQRRQQQTYHQHSQRQSSSSYSNNNNNNNNNNQNNGGYSNRNQGSYDVVADQDRGYANKNVQVQRQPLFSSQTQTSPLTAHLATNSGFGQKMSTTVKRNPFISSIDEVPTTSPRYREATQIQSASVAVLPIQSQPQIKPQQQKQQQSTLTAYSSTTKRNAIDYDTENTTPYSTSYDDDLLATVTTPRYGEVISKPNSVVYSNEYDGQSQETTTAAPLTFGQKLSRAAKKRNASSWGNWLTLMS